MELEAYRRKRDFAKTPEPAAPAESASGETGRFVIQQHDASRFHYDLRLELEGTLKSWAVPKGPSLDPKDRRLAIHVEDHPIDYADFEGVIPPGEYGAGPVLIWDRGRWIPEGDPRKGYHSGSLRFRLDGDKLSGRWHLVRITGSDEQTDERDSWLLIKSRDETARPGAGASLLEERPESVATGRTLEEIGNVEADTGASGSPRKQASRATANGEPPARPRGARRRDAPPSNIAPQLATLTDAAPEGNAWLHEMKYDGYRILCRITSDGIRLITRNGLDWTARFERIADAARELPVHTALIDGEVVVLEPDGTSSFQSLQNELSRGRSDRMTYMAFDLLHLGEYDLRGAVLTDRKAQLEWLLGTGDAGGGVIRYADHVVGRGPEVHERACDLGAEGIISKRADRPYRSGRARDWLKVKCFRRREFVIGGYTEPSGSRTGFGALLLGYYRGDRDLVYCGRVGTGFTQASLQELSERLEKLERPERPFTSGELGRTRADVHWIEPALVAEVAFTGWTADGRLRHPSFQGLREDRDPIDVRGDEEMRDAPFGARESRPADATEAAGLRLTSPNRVMYDAPRITKRDLAEFYAAIGAVMLPHMSRRPLTLLRCPNGQGEPCFFQKHAHASVPDVVRRTEIATGEGPRSHLYIDSLPGLLGLVQMGVLEMHQWGARVDDPEHADRIVIDLDPGPDVPWADVVRAAMDVRDALRQHRLDAFPGTTGGKGVHVHVPIEPKYTWSDIKQFSKSIADELVGHAPDRYTARVAKRYRRGRVYVDYLRNARGASAIVPYSTRARPGAPVAVPLTWDELRPEMKPADWTPETVRKRLAGLRGGDAWAGIDENRQLLPGIEPR